MMNVKLAGLQPKNTTNSIKWAQKIFELWIQARNSSQHDSVHTGLLTSENPSELFNYLRLFVEEKKWRETPPATLQLITKAHAIIKYRMSKIS